MKIKKTQNKFKRVEQKYLLTKVQQELLLKSMKEYVSEDEYGRNRVNSIYFDTPTNLLIRRSIQKPVYKEKLRIRSYGDTNSDTKIWIELKKKFKSVVYKRRILMQEKEAMDYLVNGKSPSIKNQILNEIDYFIKMNEGLAAKMYISCDREAYYAKDDKSFRITFDKNIIFRDYNLSLCENAYGINIIKKDMVLMELKTGGAIPLWMVKFLMDNNIYKTSFSKYGNAYKLSKKLMQENIMFKKAS